MESIATFAQIKLTRHSSACWRVTFGNPPANDLQGDMIRWLNDIVSTLETDERVKTIVFDSSVEGFFLGQLDLRVKSESLGDQRAEPVGLSAWRDVLRRLARAPVVSICLIRGRATGSGCAMAMACDLSYVSREKAILSQWQGGADSLSAAVLDFGYIGGDLAAAYGYVNRALPDSSLDGFVEKLTHQIASFDKWTISHTKRRINAASSPPDGLVEAGWNMHLASLLRPSAQDRITTLMSRRPRKSTDTESHLEHYLEQVGWCASVL